MENEMNDQKVVVIMNEPLMVDETMSKSYESTKPEETTNNHSPPRLNKQTKDEYLYSGRLIH